MPDQETINALLKTFAGLNSRVAHLEALDRVDPPAGGVVIVHAYGFSGTDWQIGGAATVWQTDPMLTVNFVLANTSDVYIIGNAHYSINFVVNSWLDLRFIDDSATPTDWGTNPLGCARSHCVFSSTVLGNIKGMPAGNRWVKLQAWRAGVMIEKILDRWIIVLAIET